MSTISGGVGPKLPIKDVTPTAPTAPTTKTSDTKTTTPPQKIEAPKTSVKTESSVVESSLASSSSSDLAVKAKLMQAAMQRPPVQIAKSTSILGQLKTFKDFCLTKAMASPLTDIFSGDTSKISGTAMTLRKFHPDASPAEKLLSQAFREFATQDFSDENFEFMDAMYALSEMDPGSPKLDASIDHLFDTFIRESASKMINVASISRRLATEAHSTFTSALATYQDDPSPENLEALNEARTDVLNRFQDLISDNKGNLEDTKIKFVKSDLFKDVKALISGEAKTGKSLKTAFYIDTITSGLGSKKKIEERVATFEKAVDLMKSVEKGVEKFPLDLPEVESSSGLKSSLTKLKETVSSWLKSSFFVMNEDGTPTEDISTRGLFTALFRSDTSSTEKQSSAAFRAYMDLSFAKENMEYADRVIELSTLEPGSAQFTEKLESIHKDLIISHDYVNLAKIDMPTHPLKVAYNEYFEAKATYADNPCPETLKALEDASAGVVEKLEKGLSEVTNLISDSKYRFISRSSSSDKALKDLAFIEANDLRSDKKSVTKALYIDKIMTEVKPYEQQARLRSFEEALDAYSGWMEKASS